ncbi:MAG: CpsB/CapC family capsule biosynthesis tyrosine phosphatase [Bacteroidota bacterium]|nr:CpsB/CapC family capsule biosynthesis tyrosine phosphatase [Bacteroidota bacterium]MDP4234202.1 CpsB/CapC family capsule biosynthesis tyrosine phosphatase [Bacteroidota bacterium]MDP4243732.1 CpsB/CapC family capsule biosynthesis tyrosine phosphatase [Bacteroidota bacterium]MDP4287903.1 CpsB/CapC family capsule biosynthesis tyrosine phosphatase [Bacteroidota bacterium]
MVDIHCHLVPGVDDGAESVDAALAMIEQARACGVTAILTTPHIRGRLEDLALHAHHKERFQLVLDRKPDMPLYLGGEVRVTSETREVVQRKEFTASEQSKYILLEMDFDQVPPYFSQLLFDYRLSGITPIVAHPERNMGVLRNPEYALEFVRHGALLQVTTGCLLGELGESFQTCAMTLVESGLVSILASDAHNTKTRPYTSWPGAYELLKRIEERTREFARPIIADKLVTEHPLAVCEGRSIPAIELDEVAVDAIRKRLSGAVHTPVKRKRFFHL